MCHHIFPCIAGLNESTNASASCATAALFHPAILMRPSRVIKTCHLLVMLSTYASRDLRRQLTVQSALASHTCLHLLVRHTCIGVRPVKENIPIWLVMKDQSLEGIRASSAALSSLRMRPMRPAIASISD